MPIRDPAVEVPMAIGSDATEAESGNRSW